MSTLAAGAAVFSIRVILALVFLSAAVPKVRHLEEFGGILENYRLLPVWTLGPMHIAIPAAELAAAAGLVCLPVPASLLAAALLVIFATAIAINLRRGRDEIDCGCRHSALRQRLRWALVWRNSLLALLALLAVVVPLQRPALVPDAMLLGGAFGVISFLLYGTLNALWAVGPVSRRRIRIAGVQV